jgi:hypothetical protein
MLSNIDRCASGVHLEHRRARSIACVAPRERGECVQGGWECCYWLFQYVIAADPVAPPTTQGMPIST